MKAEEKLSATDLRVGNFIGITYEAKKELWLCEMDIKPESYGEVTSISSDEVIAYTDSMEYEFYYEDLEPLALNEDWLIRFGFETENLEENDWFFKENETCSFGLALQDGIWLFYVANAPLYYVHQLQNLFFALTGKELSLSPILSPK